MSIAGFSKDNAPLTLFASRSTALVYTHDAFPPLPRPSGASSPFKFNPRAAPFIPGALSHPPTPVLSASPTKSDMSAASTVLQATPSSAWHHFAPRVPVAGPLGAGNLGHPGQHGHTYFAQEPTQSRCRLSRSETITQANYNAHTYSQPGGSSDGSHVVNDAEAQHAAEFTNYCAAYFPSGGAPSPGMYEYGYQAQPVYASAPQHAVAYAGGWNQGQSGGKKGKKGKKKGKKGKAGKNQGYSSAW